MRRTEWTELRLQRLFDSVAERFYPGQLTDWRVEIREIGDDERCGAFCDWGEKRIVLDMNRVPPDRVRAVLDHETAHAVSPHSGHGLRFLEETERLRRRGLRAHVHRRYWEKVRRDEESYLDQEERLRAILDEPDDDDGQEP